jgi:hypothetical protein
VWQKAVLLAILNSNGEFWELWSHLSKLLFFVMEVRIRLPCVDDSIKYQHNPQQKNVTFSNFDVANVWMEWMMMS